jgi:hypothetical protein
LSVEAIGHLRKTTVEDPVPVPDVVLVNVTVVEVEAVTVLVPFQLVNPPVKPTTAIVSPTD